MRAAPTDLEFREESRCAKCGKVDEHESAFGLFALIGVDDAQIIGDRVGTMMAGQKPRFHVERIERTCSRCGWVWLEIPLDDE